MIFERWIKSWKSAIAENFFLKVLLLTLGVGFILNASFLKVPEKVIIVPPQLKESVALEKNKAPIHYLEQMAVFFASMAGNLSPASAEYQAGVLAKYSPKEEEVVRELFGTASYIKKYNIYQSFYPESVEVEGDNPYTMKVTGKVERRVGNTVISRENVIYIMNVTYSNYRLFLNSIYPDYPEREKRKQEVMEKKGVKEETRIKLREEEFIPIEEKIKAEQSKSSKPQGGTEIQLSKPGEEKKP